MRTRRRRRTLRQPTGSSGGLAPKSCTFPAAKNPMYTGRPRASARVPSRRELSPQFRHEPARLQDLEDVWRERLEPQRGPVLQADLPAGHVEVDDLARLHLRLQARALEDREPEVDRVPEEDAREGVREDRGDPEGLQGHGRLLAARTASEVVPRHD